MKRSSGKACVYCRRRYVIYYSSWCMLTSLVIWSVRADDHARDGKRPHVAMLFVADAS